MFSVGDRVIVGKSEWSVSHGWDGVVGEVEAIIQNYSLGKSRTGASVKLDKPVTDRSGTSIYDTLTCHVEILTLADDSLEP